MPRFMAGYISRAKFRSPVHVEYFPTVEHELRGFLRVARIRHRTVGSDLVHDATVAVRLRDWSRSNRNVCFASSKSPVAVSACSE